MVVMYDGAPLERYLSNESCDWPQIAARSLRLQKRRVPSRWDCCRHYPDGSHQMVLSRRFIFRSRNQPKFNMSSPVIARALPTSGRGDTFDQIANSVRMLGDIESYPRNCRQGDNIAQFYGHHRPVCGYVSSGAGEERFSMGAQSSIKRSLVRPMLAIITSLCALCRACGGSRVFQVRWAPLVQKSAISTSQSPKKAQGVALQVIMHMTRGSR